MHSTLKLLFLIIFDSFYSKSYFLAIFSADLSTPCTYQMLILTLFSENKEENGIEMKIFCDPI